MFKGKLKIIFLWILEVAGYTILAALVPGLLLLLTEIFNILGGSFYSFLKSVGAWAYLSSFVLGISIKLARDKIKQNTTKKVNSFSEYIILMLIVAGGLAVIAVFNKIAQNFIITNSKKIYVYACPVDDSTKCYELHADEVRCAYSNEDGCDEWETTIYYPNGGDSYLTCYSLNSGKLHCTDEEDREWEVEESAKNEEDVLDLEEKKIIEELLPK